MKKLFLLTLLLVFEHLCLNAQSTTEVALQNKYWVYRDRFQKQFVKIGKGEGKSLTSDKIALNLGTWEYKGKMNFGDVMAFQGDYLGLLASEYWLLNNEGKSTTAVLNELYFAILAVERVDRTATNYFKIDSSKNQDPDGFFVRDDVPEEFYEDWEDYGDSLHNIGAHAGNGRKVYHDTLINNTKHAFFGKYWNRIFDQYHIYNKDAIYSEEFNDATYDKYNENYVRADRFGRDPNQNGYGSEVNEMSVDQIVGLLFGFKCVSKFVDWSVKVDPDGAGSLPEKNLHDWVASITNKIMLHITQTSYDVPLCDYEQQHTGSCSPNWASNIKAFNEANYCITNPAKNNKFVDRGHNALLLSYPLEKLGEELTGNDYPAGYGVVNQNAAAAGVTLGCIAGAVITLSPIGCTIGAVAVAGITESTESANFYRNLWNRMGSNQTIQEGLANSPGSNMYMYLPAASNTWTHKEYYDLTQVYKTDWAEIIYGVLNESKPMLPPSYYQGWLDNASCIGVENKTVESHTIYWVKPKYLPGEQYFVLDTTNLFISNELKFISAERINGWLGTENYPFNQFTIFNSKIRWKDSIHLDTAGKATNKELYNGMDYMLLYNFYRIATKTFYTKSGWENDNTGGWWNADNITLPSAQNTKCPCVSSRPFENYGTVKTNITASDSLETVYRFPEYTDWEIDIPEWLRHDFTLNTASKLKIKGNLNICNAQLTVNDNAELLFTPSTENRVRKLIVQSGATLNLHGKLIISNNTTVKIDKGGKLIIHPGAEIILNGSKATLHLNGRLVLEQDAVFQPKPGALGFGQLVIENYEGEQYVEAKGNNKYIIDLPSRTASHENVIVSGDHGMHSGWKDGMRTFLLNNVQVKINDRSKIVSEAAETKISNSTIKGVEYTHPEGLVLIETATKIRNSDIWFVRNGIKYIPLNNGGYLFLDSVKTFECQRGVLSEGGNVVATGCEFGDIVRGGISGVEVLGTTSLNRFRNTKFGVHLFLDPAAQWNWQAPFNPKQSIVHFGNGQLQLSNCFLYNPSDGVINFDGTVSLVCNEIGTWQNRYNRTNNAIYMSNGKLYMNQGYNYIHDIKTNIRNDNALLYLDDGRNSMSSGKYGDLGIISHNNSIQPTVSTLYQGPNLPAPPNYVNPPYNVNPLCVAATNNEWGSTSLASLPLDMRPSPSANYNMTIYARTPSNATPSTFYDLGYNPPYNRNIDYMTYRTGQCDTIVNNKRVIAFAGWNQAMPRMSLSDTPVLDGLAVRPITIGTGTGTGTIFEKDLYSWVTKVNDETTTIYDEYFNEILYLRAFIFPTHLNHVALNMYDLSHEIYYQSINDTSLSVEALQTRKQAFGNIMLSQQNELIAKAEEEVPFWKDINYELKRDKALLLRSLNRRPEGIAVLNNLIAETTMQPNKQNAIAWQCFLTQEQMVLDSIISAEDMDFLSCVPLPDTNYIIFHKVVVIMLSK